MVMCRFLVRTPGFANEVVVLAGAGDAGAEEAGGGAGPATGALDGTGTGTPLLGAACLG